MAAAVVAGAVAVEGDTVVLVGERGGAAKVGAATVIIPLSCEGGEGASRAAADTGCGVDGMPLLSFPPNLFICLAARRPTTSGKVDMSVLLPVQHSERLGETRGEGVRERRAGRGAWMWWRAVLECPLTAACG